jgi:AraC-like DNA-binding protein
MLASVQRFEVPELGLRRTFHGVFTPRLWVHIVELRGARVDERLMRGLGACRPDIGRRLVAFSVDGESVVRTPMEREWAIGGEAIVCNGRASLTGGTDARVRPSLTLSIDWDATYFGDSLLRAPAFTRVMQRRLAPVVHALRDAIEAAWQDPSAVLPLQRVLERTLAMLRAEGFAAPRVDGRELVEDSYLGLAPLSRALDVSLSFERGRPALVDLEDALRVSARTIQRRLPDVLRAWGYRPDGFSALRKRTRLFQACAVMSHSQATVEIAARATGFATPSAFCRAFVDAGLPSPGRVRTVLARLQ